MKLKVLTCKLCESPMHFEDGKLVCAYCGAVRDVEKDASDAEYEQIANAEEHIRLSLERQKQELEDYYAQEEQRQIEAEEEAARQERKRKIKEKMRRLRRTLIIFGVILAVCFASGFMIKYYVQRDAKTEMATPVTTQKEDIRKNDHVSRADLLKDPHFLEQAEGAALQQAEKVRSSNIIVSADERWSLSGTPILLETYLVTSKNESYLFFFYQSTLTTKAGDKREVYNCIAMQDIQVSSDGKVSYGSRVYEQKGGDYDFLWKCAFDLEQIRGEIIGSKRDDVMEKHFIYRL